MQLEQELRDRRALHELMLVYGASIDDRELGRFRELFAPELVTYGFGKPIDGVDAWVAFVERALERCRATQHLMGTPLLRLEGAKAILRTDVQATHWMREPDGAIFTLWGTYLGEARRTDAGWRLARHELVTRFTQTVER